AWISQRSGRFFTVARVPSTTEISVVNSRITSASFRVMSRPLEMNPQFSITNSMTASLLEGALQARLEASREQGQHRHQGEVDHADGGEHLDSAEVRGDTVHRDEGQLGQTDGLQVGRVLQ